MTKARRKSPAAEADLPPAEAKAAPRRRTTTPKAPAKAGTPARRSPKPKTIAPADPLPGQAAQEIAMIREGMRHIRQLIDSAPAPSEDARALLHRLCRNPAPQSLLAGSTASVIQLHPARTPLAAAAQVETPPVADLPAAPVAAPMMDVAAMMPMPRSRIARLLAAWGDWLMWRLMPPEIPSGPVTVVPMAEVEPAMPIAAVIDQGTVQPAPYAPEPLPQTVARLMADPGLRDHLQEMIREELEGEMGTRFSGNLRTVLRREIATALEDRLTHL